MRMIKILRICKVSFSCLLQNGGQTAVDIRGEKPDQEFGSTSASVKSVKGPTPTKDNLDMSKAICRICRKEYAYKGWQSPLF